MATTVARDGQSELSTFRDAQTGREIWQLTRSDQAETVAAHIRHVEGVAAAVVPSDPASNRNG